MSPPLFLLWLFSVFSKLLKFLVGLFKPTIYGKAQWMPFVEKNIFLNPKNKGLLFGRYRMNLEESFKNLCLIAPTGSGKTTRYVIGNILKCSGSVVVTDPSGEIFRKTSGHMSDRGYKIQVICPELTEDLEKLLKGAYLAKFNRLSRCQTKQDLKRLATILGAFNAKSEDFWTTGATSIIYVCLVALSNYDEKSPQQNSKTIGALRLLLNSFGVSGEGVRDFMKTNLDPITWIEFSSFVSQDEKVVSGMLSTAKVALDLWSDDNVSSFTSENTIDIEALRNSQTIVYVIVPEHKVKYYSLLINLFYSACFEYCLETSKGSNVFFFLDEFGNLGKIRDFETIVTTLRKRHCSISIILQAHSQLEAVYGKNDAETIWSGGMAHTLFFGGLGLKTCKELEQVLGKFTQEGIISAQANDKDRTVAVGTPLLTADQMRMMTNNEAVLISSNKKPIRLTMKPYFKNAVLRKWSRKSPFHQRRPINPLLESSKLSA